MDVGQGSAAPQARGNANAMLAGMHAEYVRRQESSQLVGVVVAGATPLSSGRRDPTAFAERAASAIGATIQH